MHTSGGSYRRLCNRRQTVLRLSDDVWNAGGICLFLCLFLSSWKPAVVTVIIPILLAYSMLLILCSLWYKVQSPHCPLPTLPIHYTHLIRTLIDITWVIHVVLSAQISICLVHLLQPRSLDLVLTLYVYFILSSAVASLLNLNLKQLALHQNT